MTNEEIIEELSSRKVSMSMCISVDDCRKSNMAIEKAIESLQENTKLKAEIERLNGKSEMYRDMADSFCESNIELKAEIEQLQSTNAKLCEENAELSILLDKKVDENAELKKVIIKKQLL